MLPVTANLQQLTTPRVREPAQIAVQLAGFASGAFLGGYIARKQEWPIATLGVAAGSALGHLGGVALYEILVRI